MISRAFLIIRADASPQRGTGHVMRCLALAQAWQSLGREVIFAVAEGTPPLRDRLMKEGMTVVPIAAVPGSAEDASEIIALSRQYRTSFIVADGYHFNDDYQHAMKMAGLRLLFVDDFGHSECFTADLVLNQNLYATEAIYHRRAAYTQLLLGPRYVLLRREFWPWRNRDRNILRAANNILVTLGGSDPNNTTRMVIRALGYVAHQDLNVKIVVGPANLYVDTLLPEIEQLTAKTQLLTSVTAMPDLMAGADLAISAGGSTCYELAFMGVPTVIIIQAENQQNIARSFADAGLAYNVGWYHELDTESLAESVLQLLQSRDDRTQMSRQGRATVDGKGAQRVVEALNAY